MEQTGIEGQALAAWENHARSWDSTMGDDGNDYFSVLELPALKRMISGQKRNRALDLATGNGLVARWLAKEGFSVVATDGARAMLEHAKARTALWSFQDLFAPFFRAGLILDALEEVNFDDTFCEPSREYAARNFTEFPKILAFRLRLGPMHRS
ncbi:unnamed protein product [Aspergillus oryzae]|nr:unnamed protein product [Aspergillus oryzae]